MTSAALTSGTQPLDVITYLAGKGILIDPQDAWVGTNWIRRSDGYCYRKPRSGVQYLHRVIMGLQPGDPRVVDHINHDPSDNRRGNLRVVTVAVNQQNRAGAARHSKTGVRGVYPVRGANKFQAQFRRNGVVTHVGRFDTVEEASAALAVARG